MLGIIDLFRSHFFHSPFLLSIQILCALLLMDINPLLDKVVPAGVPSVRPNPNPTDTFPRKFSTKTVATDIS